MHPSISNTLGSIRKASRFIGSEIWLINTQGLSRLHALLVRIAKSVIFLYNQFWEDRLLTRASALTFSSLLALVPLLAIVFTLYQSMGLHVEIEPTLREWLSPLGSNGDVVATNIMNFLANAQTGTLGYVGLVVLLFAVLGILANIEESYNDIWHVRQMRNWRATTSQLPGPVAHRTADHHRRSYFYGFVRQHCHPGLHRTDRGILAPVLTADRTLFFTHYLVGAQYAGLDPFRPGRRHEFRVRLVMAQLGLRPVHCRYDAGERERDPFCRLRRPAAIPDLAVPGLGDPAAGSDPGLFDSEREHHGMEAIGAGPRDGAAELHQRPSRSSTSSAITWKKTGRPGWTGLPYRRGLRRTCWTKCCLPTWIPVCFRGNPDTASPTFQPPRLRIFPCVPC